jgi:hypothetical protein
VPTSNPDFFSKDKWKRELVAAGFLYDQQNQRISRNGIKLTYGDQWIELRSNLSLDISDPLNALMGEPGIWKLVTYPDRQPWKVFEFPLFITTENNAESKAPGEEAQSPLAATLKWAGDTLNGNLLNGWRCPSEEDLMNLLSPKGLTVQCGPYARQGELICTPKRLVLQFPLIFNVCDDLPESHYKWLRNLLIDAQNRWKMVRIGFRYGSSATSVQAEVDLSGAPLSVLSGLFTVALSALHAVAAWVVPSAEFLVEHTSAIWALRVPKDVNMVTRSEVQGLGLHASRYDSTRRVQRLRAQANLTR